MVAAAKPKKEADKKAGAKKAPAKKK